MQQVLAGFQLGKWIWVAKDFGRHFLTAEAAEGRGGRSQRTKSSSSVISVAKK
jgi:hypothetical protein